MDSKRKSMTDVNSKKPFKKPRRFFDEAARLEEERLTKLLFGGNEEIINNLEEEYEPSFTKIDTTPDSDNESEHEVEHKRQAVWVDEDDEETTVGSALQSQGRRLPNGGMNDRSIKYSTHLKNKFETIHGKQAWADLDKRVEDNSDDEILNTVGHLAKPTGKLLATKKLQFKKVLNLNKETLTEGPIITCTRFHPTSSVALVAGLSGVASIFAVDGRKNEKLHSVAYNKFPIQCARFSADGNEAILGSVRNYFNNYDLLTGKSIQIPLPHGVTHSRQFELSPCGKFIAVAGRFGEVHLLSGPSKELICSLKQSSDCTALSFSPDSSKLYAHGNGQEVTIWDLNSRTVCHKFIDDGCVNGSTIAHSPSGQYLATGNAQGVVNIYQAGDLFGKTYPKPIKIIQNLRTSIKSLEFNSSSEILSLTSAEAEDAIRLVHFPSGTVFDNFPGFETKLGKPMVGTFSPGSGFYAVSNKKNTVSLYRLKHYKNY